MDIIYIYGGNIMASDKAEIKVVFLADYKELFGKHDGVLHSAEHNRLLELMPQFTDTVRVHFEKKKLSKK